MKWLKRLLNDMKEGTYESKHLPSKPKLDLPPPSQKRKFTIEEKREAMEDLHKEIKKDLKNDTYDVNKHTAKALGIICA